MSEKRYKVRVIRRNDGRLHPILTERGRPLVLPALWIDDLATAKFNTLKSYAADVTRIYQWADTAGIDLHQKFSTLCGLAKPALRTLAAALCTTAKGHQARRGTCERRLQAARSFLGFSMDLFIDARNDDLNAQLLGERNRDKLLARLEKLVTAKSAESSSSNPSTSFQADDLRLISAILHPASESNPFRDVRVRVRNYCLFHLAIETWARRSEIVLLEMDDIDLGMEPTVTIKEPTAINAQRRRDGASLKTQGRVVPISAELSGLLQTYIHDVRDDLLKPRVPTTALFVSSRDGRRMASGSLNQILDSVSHVPEFLALNKRLHPHALRASGASAFRRQVAGPNGVLTSEEFKDCMAYIGGWSPGSPMVQRYTRQAISERISSHLNQRGAKPC
jgi:site-specific recombinase XerD